MVYPSAVLPSEQTLFAPLSTQDRPTFAASVSLPGLDEDDDFEPSDDAEEEERDPFEPPEAEEDSDEEDEAEEEGDADSEDEDEDDSAAEGELDFGE